MKRPFGDSFDNSLEPVNKKMKEMIAPKLYRKQVRRTLMPLYKAPAVRVATFRKLGTIVTLQSNTAAGGISLPQVTVPGVIDFAPFPIAGGTTSSFSSGTISFGGSYKVNLGQVAQYSEIVNMFDNYRIKKVYLKFILNVDNAAVAQSNSTFNNAASLPIMNFAYDPDGGGLSSMTRESVLANSRCKTVRLSNMVNTSFYPRAVAVVAANSSSNVQGGLLNSKTWLDTEQSGIDHYGIKFWIDNWQAYSGASSLLTLSIIPTFIIECKNSH